MKKIICLFLVVAFMFSFAACGAETVTLHCDGEGCDNTVELKTGKDSSPDESWIIFCDDCAQNVLKD